MAKPASKAPGKRGSSDHRSASKRRHVEDQPAAARPPLTKEQLQMLDVPVDDVKESYEQRQAPSNRPGRQLWLLHLPNELDLSEGLTWDVNTTNDGRIQAICRDPEGTSFTMTEQAKEVSRPLHMVPPTGSTVMPKITKTMTITETDNLLPDPTADAERVQAAMPSADIPGIALLTDTRANGAAELDMSNKAIRQQQARQEHQAGQDMMATPLSPQQKHKKAKSESKKLKKRAQEATAVNEKQSKLQRQSSVPLLESAALHVSAPAVLQSEAAKIQEDEVQPKAEGKKDKKKKKKRKDSDIK